MNATLELFFVFVFYDITTNSNSMLYLKYSKRAFHSKIMYNYVKILVINTQKV